MRARGAAERSRRETIKTLRQTQTKAARDPERAVLVGIAIYGEEQLLTMEESLDELALLASTAGIRVVGRESQKLSTPNPGTLVGSGKVKEIATLARSEDADVVIFDEELSPAQLRNLERELDCKVLDRTALILDIFAMHANTREGSLQVELAQYAYRLPRLTRLWTHLSRQGVGGVGLRGPGETQLEMDRRDIGRRMARIREELEEVRMHRGLQRGRRRSSGMPVVAIVGYTNAGKSTLLNRLADADVLVADKLFATLDPTTRRVSLPSGKKVLFTDTVGFIQKLPTELVAAFRATLEEVGEADLLLHVADVSDRNLLAKVEAVEEVLDEIGAGGKPIMLALNKVDLVDPETYLREGSSPWVGPSLMNQVHARYDRVVPISAEQCVGIDDLLRSVEEALRDELTACDVTIPYGAGDLVNRWHEYGIVDSEVYQPDGVRLQGRVPRWLAGMLSYAVSDVAESQQDSRAG
ncbi:MAG: GTPase HflX [Anaerolineae bacterium]